MISNVSTFGQGKLSHSVRPAPSPCLGNVFAWDAEGRITPNLPKPTIETRILNYLILHSLSIISRSILQDSPVWQPTANCISGGLMDARRLGQLSTRSVEQRHH